MRFLRSGAIYLVANLASAGLPFFLLPLLTRALVPDEYAQVVAFALLVVLLGSVAGMSVHAAIGALWFREDARDVPPYVGSAVALALATIVMVGPPAMLVLWAFPKLLAGLHPIWGFVAAVTAGANVITQMRLVLWQSQHKALSSAAFQFLTSAANFSLSVGAVVLCGWGPAGRNGSFALAVTTAAILSVLISINRDELKWRPRKEHFVTLIQFGAPLIIHTFAAVLLSTTDRWVVSIRLDSQSLGIYGAGAQLGMIMAILGDAFVKSYAPWLYGKLNSENTDDRLCAVGAMYAVIPLFFATAVVMGVFLTLASGVVLGDRYVMASSIIPWFMLGGAFNGLYLSVSSVYFFNKRTGLLASVTISSGLIGVLFTAALTMKFGMAGAAMGYATSQALLGIIATVTAWRQFDLPWRTPRRALSVWLAQITNSTPSLTESVSKKGPSV